MTAKNFDNRPRVLEAYRTMTTRDAETGLIRSPSYEEVLGRLGMSPKSKGWLSRHVNDLVAEGLMIQVGVDRRRSFVVVDLADRRLDALVAAALRVMSAPTDPDRKTSFRRAFAVALASVG